MSVVVAVSGWVAALAAAGVGRLVLARRMELVQRAAHELRGPLTAARLATELYLRGGLPLRAAAPAAGGALAVGAAAAGGRAVAARVRSVPPPFRDALEGIGLELDRARLAMADLVEAPRGGRAADRVTTFDVGVLLVEAAEAWQAAARERGVRLRVEQPPGRVLVDGDRVRLAQACGNLLANAIEHGTPADDSAAPGLPAAAEPGGAPGVPEVPGPDGAPAEIVLRARAGLHTVRIEVLDDGPGLPASIPQLLRRRPRGGRRSRGRGLAIAADVAARHRGRLASAPSERGARLVLELPTAVAR